MKTKLIVLLVVSMLFSVVSVNAKSKVLLRFNLQKGSNYEMTMISDNNIDQEMMGQKMKILQKLEMGANYQVLDVLSDSLFLLEYSFGRMKLDMDVNGQAMNMDSESVDDPKSAFLKDLKDIKLKIKINSKGKVVEMEGMEEYVAKMATNPQMAQSMQMLTDEKNFKSFFEQTFSYFPQEAVEVGSKWNSSMKTPTLMNMDIAMNFEVTDIQKDKVFLNVNSDVNMEMPMDTNGMKMNIKMAGTQSGTMAIDRSDCFACSSDLTMKYDMTMKMQNPQSGEDMEIPMVMNSVIKTTIVKK